MEKLDLTKKNLKKFGITMGVVLFAITVFIMIRHKHSIFPTLTISVLFFLSALFIPNFLKPVYIFWMQLAFILSWVNTRLILVAIFYLVFTPMGLLIRLFRKDLLERKIYKHNSSYWKKKERPVLDRLNYERQF